MNEYNRIKVKRYVLSMRTNFKNRILQWVEPFIRLPVIGFDISDRSIKYVELSSKKYLEMKRFGEISLPEGVIVSGEIQDKEKCIAIMKSWLLREGRPFASSFVNAALPEEKSFVRLIQLPKVKIEDVSNAIRWEIEANIPLSPAELIYDHEIIEPLEGNQDHFDISITAFPKNIVETYVEVLKGAGLEPLALELESQAIARAIIPRQHEKTARVIIDMGRLHTSFILYSGDAIIFTTTIDVGGKIFEENIARALNVDMDKAVQIKKEVGLNRKEYGGKVFPALVPAMATVANEVKRTVEYYRLHTAHTHGASPAINEILLSGGDANLLGLDTYLASSLKLPVRAGDPFANLKRYMHTSVPPLSLNEAMVYTSAIGLAMRTFSSNS